MKQKDLLKSLDANSKSIKNIFTEKQSKELQAIIRKQKPDEMEELSLEVVLELIRTLLIFF